MAGNFKKLSTKGHNRQVKNTDLLHDIIKERDYLYDKLKETTQKYDELYKEKENQRYFYEKEITNYIRTKKDLQESIAILEGKGNKYDNIKDNIRDIKVNAEFVALNLIENGQCMAMDAICVVDKINKELVLLKEDLEVLKSDLKIGTATVEDRIDSFYYSIFEYMKDLNDIKNQFYKDNNLCDD